MSCSQNARTFARRMTSATPARLKYSRDKSYDMFVCELFVEIIDIKTWEDDCDDDKDHKDGKGRKDDKDGKKNDKDRKDDHKYYDTSCWNAHYDY
ncbi:hypothetical protein ARMSODRAFT_1022334 [Armillaria solidipes]|uniref:Uncharacterized protein n=1 Tax=Armillaria solidipes TaxID=1076256 RepID=A0A2H3B3W1_9AGAR|nr:hypothetical protein ARMSODRAFT_1022334 [Armillaria solidipes]